LTRRLLLGLLTVSLWCPRLAAQDSEGRLVVTVESVEGIPVESALIRSGSASAVTDTNGRAALVLPSGRADVRVERIGFAPVHVVVEIPPGGEASVTVVLESAALETEGIVVMSTRSDRRIEDEPLRVEVIDREEIEEKLLMTPGDIAMLLNETAGLRVQPTAPALGGASVRIQGLRGRYTLILSDGLPLYGGQSGALGPLQIPPVDLGQVEVIKGVASALYGATALGGVVNLISRKPNRERELLLNGSTLGGADAVLWLSDSLSATWGYTLLAGVHGQGQADVDHDGWADLPGFRRVMARPRLYWNNGKGSSVLATVGGMLEGREGGTVADGLTPAGTPYAEEMSTRRLDTGMLARVLSHRGQLFTVRGSASLQHHEHTFGPVFENDRHATAFLETSFAGTNGPHAWVIGAAIQHDVYRAEEVTGFDYTHTVPGVFVQDEVTVSRALLVSASARLDHHNKHGVFANPRLSALLRLAPWTIRASGGTGYFAPTPHTEEVQSVGLARLAPLPSELKAERAQGVSLDIGRELGNLELNATVFASSIDDAVQTVPAIGGGLALLNAAGPTRAWGSELLARYAREPVHLTATYVYTRSTELWGNNRRSVPYTPRHTAGVVAAWEEHDRGRIGVELYFTGRQELEDDPYRTNSRSYVIFGLLVERRVGNARFFLNAENLLDARHTRWTPLVRPALSAEGRWTTNVWAPLEGRAFNGGVRLFF
jgi:outer membrane receptor for ferrienterochelin and colicins